MDDIHVGEYELNSHVKKRKPKHIERLNLRLKPDELNKLDKLAGKRKLNRSLIRFWLILSEDHVKLL